MFKKILISQNSKLVGRISNVNSQLAMLSLKNMFAYSSLFKAQSRTLLRYGAFSSLQENPNYLFTLAQCHFRQENYAQAMEKLKEMNAEESDNIQHLKLLAKTQVALSEYVEGLQTFQKIIEKIPGDIESNVFSMGILEQISETIDGELEMINDRIIQNHKEDEGQQVAIALVSLMEEEFHIIPDLLHNINTFKIEQNRFLAYATLKEAYSRIGQYKKGVETLEEALENCPNYHQEIYFELAKLAHQADENEIEFKALKSCLELNENQFDVLVELGWIYFVKGDTEKSQEYLKKAEQIEKTNSKRFFYQAKILQSQNKLDDAQKLLEQCIQLDGSSVSAQVYNQIGVLYLQKRDVKKAQSFFFEALEINNEDAQYYFNIGLTYNLLNELDRALSYYDKGLVIQPKNVSALRTKGIIQLKQREYHDAIDTFTEALSHEPLNTDVLIELARAYKQISDKQKSLELCNKILSINPKNESAIELINILKSKQ